MRGGRRVVWTHSTQHNAFQHASLIRNKRQILQNYGVLHEVIIISINIYQFIFKNYRLKTPFQFWPKCLTAEIDFPRGHNTGELPTLIRADQLEREIKDVHLDDKTSQQSPSS
jgi:hypothetical protein